MNMQHQSSALQSLDGVRRQVYLGGVLRLQARCAGWLTVDSGQVWITRNGDFTDHVLASGDRLHLGRGEQVLVEPWRAGKPARLGWAAGEAVAVPAPVAVVPASRPVASTANQPASQPANQPAAPGHRPRGQLAPC